MFNLFSNKMYTCSKHNYTGLNASCPDCEEKTPKVKNKDKNPIFYKDSKEMDKPLSELMEGLRGELSDIRGKLSDIKHSYGWEDEIKYIEGGLTCMLVAMHHTMELWKEFENKQKNS